VFLQTVNMSAGRKNLPEVNHLQAWRLHRRMTQEELAKAVDTTGAVISLLESGARGLSAKWLRRLAPALGTTPGFLLDHHPDDIPTDVMEIWGDIPASQRDQAIRVLEAFRKAS
jgi:transcriptional regulator with XRE-family HTH domain